MMSNSTDILQAVKKRIKGVQDDVFHRYDDMSPDCAQTILCDLGMCLDLIQAILNEGEYDGSNYSFKTITSNKKLMRRVDDLDLPTRAVNALWHHDIFYVGELVQKEDHELLRTPNFGRKSLKAIKEALANIGLKLNMDIDEWSPNNGDNDD
jgi:DNA-directed RNA polymerase alpha subunit